MQCQMLSLDLVLTAGIGQKLRGVGNGRRTKEPSKELSVMAIPVVEFSREGYKIKRFLTETQITKFGELD